MFYNEPVYVASLEIELLAFRFHVVLRCKFGTKKYHCIHNFVVFLIELQFVLFEQCRGPTGLLVAQGDPHAPTSLTRLNENEVGNTEPFKFKQTDHTDTKRRITCCSVGSHNKFHLPRQQGIKNTVLNLEKSKAILLQAWTGPEGSSRLRLPDIKTVGT